MCTGTRAADDMPGGRGGCMVCPCHALLLRGKVLIHRPSARRACPTATAPWAAHLLRDGGAVDVSVPHGGHGGVGPVHGGDVAAGELGGGVAAWGSW